MSVVAKRLGTKMPLDMGVGLGPGDFVFDGDPAYSQNKGHNPLPIFGPYVDKRLDGSRCHCHSVQR